MGSARFVRQVATAGPPPRLMLLALVWTSTAITTAEARGEFLLRAALPAPASLPAEAPRRLGLFGADDALPPLVVPHAVVEPPDGCDAGTLGRARVVAAPLLATDPAWCHEPRPAPPAEESAHHTATPPERSPGAASLRLPEPPAFVLGGMGLALLFALSVRRQIHRLNAAA